MVLPTEDEINRAAIEKAMQTAPAKTDSYWAGKGIDINYWRRSSASLGDKRMALERLGLIWTQELEHDLTVVPPGSYESVETYQVIHDEGLPTQWIETKVSAMSLGTAQQIKDYEKYQAGLRGEVMPELVYDPKMAEDLEKIWGKSVVEDAALAYYKKLKPIQEEEEARKKFQSDYIAAEKVLNKARDDANAVRKIAGLPPLEEKVVDPLVKSMLDEADQVSKDAEEAVAIATRIKELMEKGFDTTEADEMGVVYTIHHTVTESEARDMATAEREAAKTVVKDMTMEAMLGAMGNVFGISSIGLDLLALASPNLASRLRKIVKPVKGIVSVARKKVKAPAVKAAKLPVKKIKKLITKTTKTRTLKPKKEVTAIIKKLAGSPERKYLIVGDHQAAVYYTSEDYEIERLGEWKG